MMDAGAWPMLIDCGCMWWPCCVAALCCFVARQNEREMKLTACTLPGKANEITPTDIQWQQIAYRSRPIDGDVADLAATGAAARPKSKRLCSAVDSRQ